MAITDGTAGSGLPRRDPDRHRRTGRSPSATSRTWTMARLPAASLTMDRAFANLVDDLRISLSDAARDAAPRRRPSARAAGFGRHRRGCDRRPDRARRPARGSLDLRRRRARVGVARRVTAHFRERWGTGSAVYGAYEDLPSPAASLAVLAGLRPPAWSASTRQGLIVREEKRFTVTGTPELNSPPSTARSRSGPGTGRSAGRDREARRRRRKRSTRWSVEAKQDGNRIDVDVKQPEAENVQSASVSITQPSANLIVSFPRDSRRRRAQRRRIDPRSSASPAGSSSDRRRQHPRDRRRR